MMNSTLKLVGGTDENKTIIIALNCKTFLTYTKMNKQISEWFPANEFYELVIQKDGNKLSMNGPIRLHIHSDSIVLALGSNIWIPSSRNDELAIINGDRLTAILKTIEKIVRPTKMYASEYWNRIDKYGYKKPEELFPNDR